MDENLRDFKGVWIPKEVWLDERLSALEKIILTEIDSLDNGEKGCWASNSYLADFCQCSEATITRAITKLKDLGYLTFAAFDGRTRLLQSRLRKKTTEPPQNDEAAPAKVHTNNINNNQDNNKNNNNIYIAVIDYLNQKAGTAYRSGSKATQSHINARLKEGFTVEDFKKVIDNKCADWKGTEWEKFLRPETLFGSKFENYLNAKVKTARPRDTDLDEIF